MPEKTMKMNIKQRLVLLNTLPKEGDIVTVRVLKNLKQELGLTEEEIKDLEVKQENGRIGWDETKDQGKDIPMGDVARGIVKSTLQDLDRQKKLSEDHIELWDMFC